MASAGQQSLLAYIICWPPNRSRFLVYILRMLIAVLAKDLDLLCLLSNLFMHSGCCFLLQANYLRSLGVKKGDAVSIYMPMVCELPIAMLACARIGAVHSVVFGGFSAEALAGEHLRITAVFGGGCYDESARKNLDPSC